MRLSHDQMTSCKVVYVRSWSTDEVSLVLIVCRMNPNVAKFPQEVIDQNDVQGMHSSHDSGLYLHMLSIKYLYLLIIYANRSCNYC